ncbi:MAG: transporter substrate-binding domain-containing protein, partial [Bryobacteraceae bacterium]
MAPLLSKMFRLLASRRGAVITGISVCLLVLAVWCFRSPSVHAVRRYRIAYDNAPPYSEVSPGGMPQGLAVDILKDAANRLAIELEWVAVMDTAPDKALREGLVDLWPIVGITPERKRV